MDQFFWIGLAGALAALLFALFQSRRVLSFSEGNDTMKKIAAAIREGANAYLRHQYATVAKVFFVVFLVLLALAYFQMLDNWFIPFAFLTGGIYSALAGFVGMKIATSANARTAQAASESLNKGLNVAFSSGAVMGFTVVGLGLLDISVWFHILKYIAHFDAAKIAQTMVMFGIWYAIALLLNFTAVDSVTPLVYVSLFMIAMGIGGSANFTTSLPTSIFGRQGFDKVNSVIFPIQGAVTALCFLVNGVVQKITGGQIRMAYLVFAGVALVNVLLVLMVNEHKYNRDWMAAHKK